MALRFRTIDLGLSGDLRAPFSSEHSRTQKRLLAAAVISVVIGGPQTLALAQTSDVSDVEALREEVELLRSLVESLVEAQGEQSLALEDALILLDEPQAQSNTIDAMPTEESGSISGLLTSRQPLGRFPDDAFVTRGNFDRSINVPGTDGAFRIGGIVIVSSNYDFDNLGFQQISTQPTIPLDGSRDDETDQFSVHVRSSRVNFDYRQPTRLGEFRTFVEFGFFQEGSEFVNDYSLSLRHAAAEVGNWKFGQFWSGFMDVFSQPETADAGGPLALPSKRQPGIFYVSGDRAGSNWGIGIENPAADLGGRTDLIQSESMPNIVAFRKLQSDWGHVRLAAMGLQLRSTNDEDYTAGVQLSGRLNTPWFHERDNFAFGAQAGGGFVSFYSSFVGGLDGVVFDDGSVESTGVLGAFGAYQHWWSDRWRSTLNASFFDFDLPTGADPLAYANGHRLSGNLVWTPVDGVNLGWELNYDTIETANGSEGEGLRAEFAASFNF